MTTTIQISDEVWDEIKKKKRRGQTFDDVLKLLLKIEKENKNIHTQK